MTKYKYLGWPLAANNPGYGTLEACLDIERLRDMEKGDSCNLARLGFENHWGTHVDAPNHFFRNGRKIIDYPPETWIFNHPCIVEVAAGEGYFVTPADVEGKISKCTNFLIVRTGWTSKRGSEEYSFRAPGLSPELGELLRAEYPALRAVGVETTSISSMADRERGRAAHRAFLDPDGIGQPLLLFEGMRLPDDLGGLKKIIAVPLLVEEIDSAPVTIIGEFETEK